MERILVSGPSITQKEIDYVTEAVSSAWNSNANVFNERFEKAFSSYVGLSYAIALPSCTSAIHLSLMALGIKKDDEVIVPDITWIASAAPISYVGATPVFADVDPETWCLSADSFQACITSKTKAVIPVDLYGGMPDMDAIRGIAERHGVAVIEDAAEAIGSVYKGRKAGSCGELGVFSFHGSKTMTTGEGGMLVTNREDMYRRALVLRDHGRQPADRMFFNAEVAHKYKMSSMQAALGLAQIERIEALVEIKRKIFGWYHEELGRISGITLNREGDGVKNSYWMVTAILDEKYGMKTEELMAKLSDQWIDTRPFFHPLSTLPAYRDSEQAKSARERNIVSQRISPYGINLPSGLHMTREKVAYVCKVLRSELGTK